MGRDTAVQDAFYKVVPHLVDTGVNDDGTISYADRRFVLFYTPMFSHLVEAMKEVTGPIIETEIRDFGVQAGSNIAEKMDAKFKDSSLMDTLSLLVKTGFDIRSLRQISDTGDMSMIQKIFGYGQFVGWVGRIDIEAYSPGEEAVFRVYNSFESDSYGETGKKECSFVLGVMKGIMSYYWETTNITVTETACICEGADTCRVKVEHNA